MTQVSGQTTVIGITNTLLQSRLKLISETVPQFWAQRLYPHFTNHGPEHSERVLFQRIAQLAQALPLENRLNEDEIFIISAAAWLYETGTQSPNLQPTLDFAYEPGVQLSFEQLLKIRENRHLLTRQLIADSIRPTYAGSKINLGLINGPDEYTLAIAEVCRWCSQEDLDLVEEFIPVNGILVRLRLMVALLRLADQLYIDGSRVNRDLLLAFGLPRPIEARWWAYQYAQILPIKKGKLIFYYSLPERQRQYLGHIRALIEPTFYDNNNPLIRYLDQQHDLSLSVQQQPQVRLDQTEGFLREMPLEMVNFLRETVEPIESKRENVELVGYADSKPVERHPLMILDYENLILELGLDGAFPSSEEIKKIIFSITVKAHESLGDMADLWALGHWERPDMALAREELEQLTYQLISLQDEQKNKDLLQSELAHLLQRPNAPNKTLLVTPRDELSPVVKQFRDREVPVTVWLSNATEMSRFRLITRLPQALAAVVDLPPSAQSAPEVLRAVQNECLLALDDELHTRPDGSLDITRVTALLNARGSVQGHGEWWKFWLLRQGILLVEETSAGYGVRLEKSHPEVHTLLERRKQAIDAAQFLKNAQIPLNLETLSQKMGENPQWRDQQEDLTRFCQILLNSSLFRTITDHTGSRRELNVNHWYVQAEDAGVYLPLFLLGIDHFLLREQFPCIHEHSLNGRLANYPGYYRVQPLYRLAREQGLVTTTVSQQTFRNSQNHMVEVRLVEEQAILRETRRNCALLLQCFFKQGTGGLTQDELWRFLQKDEVPRGFTLSRQAMEAWLAALQRADALRPVQNAENGHAPTRLRLHLDNPLVGRLLARPHLLNLIKQINIIRHQRPAVPVQEILDGFTRYLTFHPQLSRLTLQLARERGIVFFTPREKEGKKEEHAALDYDHPFVHDLSRRNKETCLALANLVDDLSKGSPEKRVGETRLHLAMAQEHRYGETCEEFDYWLQQAKHKFDLLADNYYRGHRGPLFYWVKPAVRTTPTEVK